MASTKIPLELTAYAPDADGATLELQTTDTTVTDGSVLGKIEFKAPKEASGTDAILVGAAIEAVAEGTFAADNNATELVFKTGASEAAAQKMVLTSAGNVGIGTTPTLGALHVTSATNDIVTFENTSSGTTGAQLALFHNSSSPADGDRVGALTFQGDDDGGIDNDIDDEGGSDDDNDTSNQQSSNEKSIQNKTFFESIFVYNSLLPTAISLAPQINSILSILDEPYSDPSVIPSYLLCNAISKEYKVAISGDGGDELLGGYERTMRSLQKPGSFRNLISKAYNLYPAILGTGNKLLSNSGDLETKYRSFLEDKKLTNLLNVSSSSNTFAEGLDYKDINFYKKLLIADYKFFLPEMMMFKIDRTSMANSLEVRSPFVDHKLIEFIMSNDTTYLNPRNSKEILKKYLSSDFSEEFIFRKKQGFIFDVEGWVFSNLDYITDKILNGHVVNGLNNKVINLLSINKSRINGQRIWKLFVLEHYLERVLSKSL